MGNRHSQSDITFENGYKPQTTKTITIVNIRPDFHRDADVLKGKDWGLSSAIWSWRQLWFLGSASQASHEANCRRALPLDRHSRARGNPETSHEGNQFPWIPAFSGMTVLAFRTFLIAAGGSFFECAVKRGWYGIGGCDRARTPAQGGVRP